MKKLGFESTFYGWIKECISTTSFSILVNGNPTGYFTPERGLRQGDPLSPYLFLICTEGLSMLIGKELESGALHEFRIKSNGIPVTHLFFADDSVLFGIASEEKALCIVEVLKIYACVSGLTKKKNVGGLGFRDIQCFNLAFLAKIGWRLAQKPMSLLATVLRDKYYPGGSFMAASKGKCSSWGWKGIFEARQVLMQGLMWRVGDGAGINIRDDPWFPKPSTFKVRPRVGLQSTLVCDLIDPFLKEWNVDLVSSGFYKEDVATIMGIPLSRMGCDDRLVWHYNTNREYSVKSGYGVAVNLMDNGALGKKGRGMPSDNTKNPQEWMQIWKLNVPNKIKLFIWRCYNHALAVKRNLKRHHMRVDNVKIFEKVGGIFVSRSRSAALRTRYRRRLPMACGNFGKIEMILFLMEDFAGLLQAAGDSGVSFCHSAATTKACAIREALFACIENGFANVVVESDAKMIIQMIRKEANWDCNLECILGDIEILARRMTSVMFSYVPRERNCAAHSVAKYAFIEGSNFVWDCIGPEFLFNILAKDESLHTERAAQIEWALNQTVLDKIALKKAKDETAHECQKDLQSAFQDR
ncbi:uncharacterized protein [Malus domestica]|uniref:uncharacterized protein n=1 Tax=Malus domestica TaxID=3750 RepID=UPI0039762116